MRQATENDLRAIEILLEANDLPNIHLAPYIKQFMVVETDDNVLIGVIGLHTTGKKALLRSLFRYRDETVELGLCWCSMPFCWANFTRIFSDILCSFNFVE